MSENPALDLQRLHEGRRIIRDNCTMFPPEVYAAVSDALDGSLIPAERYSALAEAAGDVRHEASLYITCEHEGKPNRVCKELSCYPLCKAMARTDAALKGVSR